MVTVLFPKTRVLEILISCLYYVAETLLSLVVADSASLETIISSFLDDPEPGSFEKGQYLFCFLSLPARCFDVVC